MYGQAIQREKCPLHNKECGAQCSLWIDIATPEGTIKSNCAIAHIAFELSRVADALESKD